MARVPGLPTPLQGVRLRAIAVARGKHNPAKVELYNFYGGVCCYCREPVRLRDATRDHYLSLSAGGSDAFENLRLACKPCNGIKADMSPLAWEAFMAARRPSVRKLTRAEILARTAPRWSDKRAAIDPIDIAQQLEVGDAPPQVSDFPAQDS